MAKRPAQPKHPRGSREASPESNLHLETKVDAKLHGLSDGNYVDINVAWNVAWRQHEPQSLYILEHAAQVSVDTMTVQNSISAQQYVNV